jgi:alpha-L-arabinofuranosidase
MKTGGSEGFVIMFHVRGRDDYLWWNVGGWGNMRSALEKSEEGHKKEFGESANVTVEPNRWYDIRIELSGTDIKCYLDDKLVTEATDPAPTPLDSIYATASRVDSTGEVILKVVNISGSAQKLEINLSGAKDVSAAGKVIVLSGKPTDVNSLANPKKVYPTEQEITDAGATFTHEFAGDSVNVVKIEVKP